MTDQEFTAIVDSIQVKKGTNANGALTLTVVNPKLRCGLTIAGMPHPNYQQKQTVLRDCFNGIIRAVAAQVGFNGKLDKFFVASTSEARRHLVIPVRNPGSNDVVYIRSNRGYNHNGSKKGTHRLAKGGTHTLMKNRKVTLTLITLPSGFGLTLQITGSSKDATAWTRFCDPDLSKAEYDNLTWTKDVESANKEAVAAVDAMIQIEEDYAAGKLDKDAALEQLKDKYIEWAVAHLSTNPEFVERRIPGLNCEGDLMAAYKETETSEAE